MAQIVSSSVLVMVIALTGCGSLIAAPVSPTVAQTPTAAPTSTPTPAPSKPFSEVGLNDAELRAWYGPVDPDCGSCIPTQGNCSEFQGIETVTYPEWEALFPKTHFYLIMARVIQNAATNMYGSAQSNHVIAQQGEDRYSVEDFGRLLAANDITIGETNREQVARAFALMALANHLKGKVTFTSLEPGQWPDDSYQYGLTAWTEIQGYQVEFVFGFKDDVMLAGWGTRGSEVGAYIEEPYAFPPEGRLYLTRSG